jgi:hypothetical protein
VNWSLLLRAVSMPFYFPCLANPYRSLLFQEFSCFTDTTLWPGHY